MNFPIRPSLGQKFKTYSIRFPSSFYAEILLGTYSPTRSLPLDIRPFLAQHNRIYRIHVSTCTCTYTCPCLYTVEFMRTYKFVHVHVHVVFTYLYCTYTVYVHVTYMYMHVIEYAQNRNLGI